MKDREWCDMDDESDVYLGRCLKNWTAQYRPPVDGREQLLKMAVSPPVQRERKLFRFLHKLNRLSADRVVFHPQADWGTWPVTQSRAWSFHIEMEATWRLAN